MSFDYESSMTRISQELKILAEEVWPEVKTYYDEYGIHIPEDKAEAVYFNSQRIKDEFKRKKFMMLREFSLNCYWHADDNWPEIRKMIPKEDENFYSTLMIEQAKKGHKENQLGYEWIVESYDNGNLRDFISDELLKEAVNKGFWEIANNYFTSIGLVIPWDYYETLMKYKEHLDLRRLNEFKTKPLIAKGDWPDENYLMAFEAARPNLDIESGAWLARPIISQSIGYVFSLYGMNIDWEKLLSKKMESFSDYLKTNIIQDLFKEKMTLYIGDIVSDEASDSLHIAQILSKYLDLKEPEIRDLVDSAFPIEDYGIESIVVDLNFPREWLKPETLQLIQQKILKHLEEKPHHRDEKQIIPHIHLLQSAVKLGFLDSNIGKDLISEGLKNYLEKKQKPGGASVSSLLRELDSQVVEQDLYRAVIHKGISDLVYRKREEEATRWFKIAEKAGWLDKSKIPTFNLANIKKEILNPEQNKIIQTKRFLQTKLFD